ncbi:hypothetical protein BZA05DRAFT_471321 [Tricharina praecox]|uniref:uncharacterized protein n=1 Tax=Tricharina praecox TaxID=43433 RepID=UPI0022204A0B|nr:uncharacterized protein BZA05DRAFT_471321 [Tricharina praecox]KAI5857239.1 hypothetical protein BZA05DRAFT_471321 [Tricharina praecox]
MANDRGTKEEEEDQEGGNFRKGPWWRTVLRAVTAAPRFRDRAKVIPGACHYSAEFDFFEEIMLGRGDVVLETINEAGKRVGYLVGSQILCITSPVFRAMLGRASSFKEGIDTRRAAILGHHRPAVIRLEDDSDALGLVLRVLHHRYDFPDEDVGSQRFVKITEICCKYELRKPFQALADDLKELLDLEHVVTATNGYEDCVLISYVFGYERLFTVATKEVILWSRKGLHFEHNQRLSASTPSSTIAQLEQERNNRANILRTHIESIQTEWSAPSSHKCLRATNGEHCEALGLGNLIKTIVRLRLNEKESWDQELNAIFAELGRIPPLPLVSHEQCDWVPALHDFVQSTRMGVKGLKLSDSPP